MAEATWSVTLTMPPAFWIALLVMFGVLAVLESVKAGLAIWKFRLDRKLARLRQTECGEHEPRETDQ